MKRYSLSLRIYRNTGVVDEELANAKLGTYFRKKRAINLIKKLSPKAEYIWDDPFVIHYKYVDRELGYTLYYTIHKIELF